MDIDRYRCTVVLPRSLPDHLCGMLYTFKHTYVYIYICVDRKKDGQISLCGRDPRLRMVVVLGSLQDHLCGMSYAFNYLYVDVYMQMYIDKYRLIDRQMCGRDARLGLTLNLKMMFTPHSTLYMYIDMPIDRSLQIERQIDRQICVYIVVAPGSLQDHLCGALHTFIQMCKYIQLKIYICICIRINMYF